MVQTPNAINPCWWYYIHRNELIKPASERTITPHAPMVFSDNGKWEANPNWPTERTPGDMFADLAACKADSCNGGVLKKNPKKQQVLPVDLCRSQDPFACRQHTCGSTNSPYYVRADSKILQRSRRSLSQK